MIPAGVEHSDPRIAVRRDCFAHRRRPFDALRHSCSERARLFPEWKPDDPQLELVFSDHKFAPASVEICEKGILVNLRHIRIYSLLQQKAYRQLPLCLIELSPEFFRPFDARATRLLIQELILDPRGHDPAKLFINGSRQAVNRQSRRGSGQLLRTYTGDDIRPVAGIARAARQTSNPYERKDEPGIRTCSYIVSCFGPVNADDSFSLYCVTGYFSFRRSIHSRSSLFDSYS